MPRDPRDKMTEHDILMATLPLMLGTELRARIVGMQLDCLYHKDIPKAQCRNPNCKNEGIYETGYCSKVCSLAHEKVSNREENIAFTKAMHTKNKKYKNRRKK